MLKNKCMLIRLPFISVGQAQNLLNAPASSRSLKCTLDMAKRSFYRAANAILGKVGGRAPEDVILELIRLVNVCLH